MKERPIIFSGPMVRAILEGRKTQTRRAVWSRYRGAPDTNDVRFDADDGLWYCEGGQWLQSCPYGAPGDCLWVREKWWVVERDGEGIGKQFLQYDDEWSGPEPSSRAPLRPIAGYKFGPHPSIHMPRWASRITLEVIGIRVERLQDISDADAEAEGCPGWYSPMHPDHGSTDARMPSEEYRELWEDINGAGSWDANPWVWVIEFRALNAVCNSSGDAPPSQGVEK